MVHIHTRRHLHINSYFLRWGWSQAAVGMDKGKDAFWAWSHLRGTLAVRPQAHSCADLPYLPRQPPVSSQSAIFSVADGCVSDPTETQAKRLTVVPISLPKRMLAPRLTQCGGSSQLFTSAPVLPSTSPVRGLCFSSPSFSFLYNPAILAVCSFG